MDPTDPRVDCDAVLLDATGTLFYPYPSVGAVYAAMAREHGYEAEAAALDAGFRAAWRERAPSRFGADPARRTSDALEKTWWRGTVRRTFEHAGLPAPNERCFEAIFGRFADPASWRLFPDALPAIAVLRQGGLRVGIVSNFDSRLKGICAGLALAGAVHFIMASAEVGFAKPARQIFDAAIQRAGASASRTLVVGDSLDEDVAGARRAGCAALLLDRERRRRGPDVIHALTELPQRLGIGQGA